MLIDDFDQARLKTCNTSHLILAIASLSLSTSSALGVIIRLIVGTASMMTLINILIAIIYTVAGIKLIKAWRNRTEFDIFYCTANIVDGRLSEKYSDFFRAMNFKVVYSDTNGALLINRNDNDAYETWRQWAWPNGPDVLLYKMGNI